jgi:hypothetical protein
MVTVFEAQIVIGFQLLRTDSLLHQSIDALLLCVTGKELLPFSRLFPHHPSAVCSIAHNVLLARIADSSAIYYAIVP